MISLSGRVLLHALYLSVRLCYITDAIFSTLIAVLNSFSMEGWKRCGRHIQPASAGFSSGMDGGGNGNLMVLSAGD